MPRKTKQKDETDSKKSQKQDDKKDSKLESIVDEKQQKKQPHEKENQKLPSGRITRSMAEGLQGQNYQFYKNQIASSPNDNIHKEWYGQWDLLEMHHGYIQWIFPVFESAGMNWRSSPLSKAEAKLIREDLECAFRVVKSYRMMLNFYGIRLVNEETGELERDPKCWKERYRNLSVSSHNYLRISIQLSFSVTHLSARILMSLGQMGFRRYKEHLVKHFKKEVENDGPLKSCERSLDKFWVPMLDEGSAAYRKKTLENDEDRSESVFFKTGAYKTNAGAPQQDQNSNANDTNNNNNSDAQQEENSKEETKDEKSTDAMDIEQPQQKKGKRKSKY